MTNYNPQTSVREVPPGTALAIITDPRNNVIYDDVGYRRQRGHIIKIFAVIVALFVIGSIFLATSDTQPAQPAQAAALNMVTIQPPTKTATSTATATPFYTPTQDAVQRAKLAFVVTEQAATQAAINIKMTADASDFILTQAVQISTRTAQSATAQAAVQRVTESAKRDAAALSSALTAIPLAETATAEIRLIEIQAEKRNADIVSSGISVGLFVGVLFLCGVFYFIYRVYCAEIAVRQAKSAALNFAASQPVDFTPVAPVKRPEPARVSLETNDGYNFQSVMWEDLPINQEELMEVCRIVKETKRYSQLPLTGAGNPLTKNNGAKPGTFDTFGDWMIKNKIAKREGRMIVILHPEFFEQVG